MATHLNNPTTVLAAGRTPKVIDEFVGRVSTSSDDISIAHMHSPAGWSEPGQTPTFTEYSLVVSGVLRVELRDGSEYRVKAGEGFVAEPGEWVRYSTPETDGAEYIAVCRPAFSEEAAHRDSE